MGTRRGLLFSVSWYSLAAIAHLARRRLEELHGLPLPARPRRGRQLARRRQDRRRVVPQARARLGRGALRQRLGHRRRHRAGPRHLHLRLRRQLAPGFRHHRPAGLCLGARLEELLPSAGVASQYRRRRTGHDRRSPNAPKATPRRPAPAEGWTRAALAPRHLGRHPRPLPHRSGLVLHHRLVRHLPRRQGLPHREHSRRLLDSLPRRRPRQLLRRRLLQLADPPRLAGARRAQARSSSSAASA